MYRSRGGRGSADVFPLHPAKTMTPGAPVTSSVAHGGSSTCTGAGMDRLAAAARYGRRARGDELPGGVWWGAWVGCVYFCFCVSPYCFCVGGVVVFFFFFFF